MNYQLKQTPMTQPLDLYFLDTLKMIIGRSVVIETVRGSLQGILTNVMPDHMVVKSYDSDTVFYVRIPQIVYVMPS